MSPASSNSSLTASRSSLWPAGCSSSLGAASDQNMGSLAAAAHAAIGAKYDSLVADYGAGLGPRARGAARDHEPGSPPWRASSRRGLDRFGVDAAARGG